MKIEPLNGAFSVCQMKSASEIDWTRQYTFLARTDSELSLVCPSEAVPENTVKREDGWRAFRIQGTLDFSLVGILARIATCLAEEQISIFALSTYDTDYVLVKQTDFDRALDILARNGYEILRKGTL